MTRSGPPQGNQRGAALLITLILVALISLLAFGASQATRTQQQLATNEAASQIAFQGAEAGLRAAEQEIAEADDLALFCNTGSSRYAITTETELFNDDHWKSLEAAESEAFHGAAVGFSLHDSASGDFMRAPRYLVGCIDANLVNSYLGSESAEVGKNTVTLEPRYFFRVFSIGFGPGGTMRKRLEARYVF
ncbi:pilus assembly PilX family protein [Salinicola sp. V024]|uniref:pilus assembly PilX family protein n=1 Tax=Salinicola sp. V024 TaxID=3459609 RepID=UPI0040445EDD